MTADAPSHDDIALAGEYALHLLDAKEDKRVRERVQRDPVFATLVADWEEQFSQMNHEVNEVAADPAVREAVLKRVMKERRAEKRGRGVPIWAWAILVVAVLGLVAFVLLRPPAPTALVTQDGRTLALVDLDPSQKALRVTVPDGAPPSASMQVWAQFGTDDPIWIGALPRSGVASLVLSQDQYALWFEAGDGVRIVVTSGAKGAALARARITP